MADGKQKTVLITGGAGFFGDLLKRELLRRGIVCVSVDLEADCCQHPLLTSFRGDIRDRHLLEKIAGGRRFDAVFHLAAILAHAVKDQEFLWSSNVEGTRNIAALANRYGIPTVVYTSSNCLWGKGFGRPVTEDDIPEPVEIYGRSKWEGEKILLDGGNAFAAVVIRCPTIVAAGRLGLLAILFEFIDEGRRVWVVGGGENRYQFIAARDLTDACIRALDYGRSDIFNIGSDDVPTLGEAYGGVIAAAGTGARVASIPRGIALPVMRAAYHLGLSPLGPYQYRMIAESFRFDTTRIKARLGWSPTLTNGEMLLEAYRYYHEHRDEIRVRTGGPAHRRAADMGIVRLLKWLS